LPGSQWQTSINIIGGSNNTIADNSVGPRPTSGLAEFANDGKYLSNYPDNGIYEPLPDFVNDEFARLGDNDPGAFDSAEGPQDLFMIETLSRAEAFGSSAVSAVPETATWIQIILGFGLVGAFRRLQARIGNAPTPNARPRLR
jgi:hypothetical protein